VVDNRAYLTSWQFSELPFDAQLTVWDAHMRGLVGAVPATAGSGGPLRYRRADVDALLRETEAARG
jgi:hypothetical protein